MATRNLDHGGGERNQCLRAPANGEGFALARAREAAYLIGMPQQERPPMDPASSETLAAVDPRLLEFLVCPLTKTPLRYDRERRELISDAARLAYRIRSDGIPVMLPDEARKIDD
jgi:uncharacterized protein YbaR (Trm112 family)